MSQRAYQYRFYPTQSQVHTLACTFGCCRFVYNWALKLRTTAYFEHDTRLYHHDLSAALTALKREEGTTWLAEVSSVPLQQSLRHLDKAFVNFFEHRTDYPTYHKKHQKQSATYAASAFVWNGSTLTLAKQKEPLDIAWSRSLPEGCTPSSVTVSKDNAGRYFLSILVDEQIATLPITEKNLGIDVGLKSFLITSDGETIDNPKYYVRNEKKLAKLQRHHARKKKGSKNRDKARKKVACLLARIVDTRRDFQQQLSTRLIRENQTICLESLAVKNMLKNHCFAKAIQDVGWSEFARQLEYKAAWYGRTIVKIDRWYPSSKTCSGCGFLMEDMPLEVREWVCPQCGVCHDRDINAAKNIVTEGLSALNACGGTVRRGRRKSGHAGSVEAGSPS